MQFSATISLGGWRHAADGAPREGRGAAARHHSSQPLLAAILASSSGRAKKLAGEKDRDDGDKIKELYLRAFSREPHSNEVNLATEYLNRKIKDDKGNEKAADRNQSYEDIVWALFNTKEFLFNH